MSLLKIYIGNVNYNNQKRIFLVDYLKPIIPKKQIEKYHLSSMPIQIVDSQNESDCFLLPYSWNYYIKTNKVNSANEFIIEAKESNKKIIIWVSGDYHFSLPPYDNIIGLYASIYRSKLNANIIPLPVIIRDPLSVLEFKEIEVSAFKKQPMIGFCGHVDSNLIVSIIKVIRLLLHNLKHYLKFYDDNFEPILPATYLRKKILLFLENSENIKTNFIRRNRYKGGKLAKSHSVTIKRDFLNNIINSDYTLCIRGSGNFSARFYETLALGRIPVFINTDCALPFSDLIEWKKHVVWVEMEEVANVHTKILSFHKSLTSDQFINLQISNRRLWEQYFSYPGFFIQSTSYLKKIINEA